MSAALPAEALTVVDTLFRRGVISALDKHLARALQRLEPEAARDVLTAAALASRAVAHGHVCLELSDTVADRFRDADGQSIDDLELPEPSAWTTALTASALVCPASGALTRPLVLDDDGRVYLQRYAQYEQRLVASLTARIERRPAVDEARLKSSLERLFPASGSSGIDWQRVATVMAVRSTFAVVSGGPGTGKTTTVAKILAALTEQAGARPLRVLLLAPTGKAASRLGETLTASMTQLPVSDDVRQAIPQEASTIHRALGTLPRSTTRFRHDADNPLSADVVLVDEASMVDIALMTKLCEAVPRAARLILLGDKDQLASVEAGAILGDIYNSDVVRRYSPDLTALLRRLTGDALPAAEILEDVPQRAPLVDCTVHLRDSYRYPATSGIGALARAVNEGSAEAATALLRDGGNAADVRLHQPTGEGAPYAAHAHALATRLVSEDLAAYAQSATVEAALSALKGFRVLAAHRRGALGVPELNLVLERWLQDNVGLDASGDHYHLRPVMITTNDYQVGLYNGDIGVIFHDPDGRPWAYFDGPTGLRRLLPSRLPLHETVFAMTIHKSQGSEFEKVVCVLPERQSRLLTRELVYTGITRARKRVDVIGTSDALHQAIGQRIYRASGLRAKLWP